MNLLPVHAALTDAADVVGHFPTADAALMALQTAKNAIDAAMAQLVVEAMESEEHKEHGFSSMTAYLRGRLRLSGREAKKVQNRGRTLTVLDDVLVDDAARGAIRAEHVDEFGYGLKILGEDSMREPALAAVFVEASKDADPSVLHAMIRQTSDVLYPDQLDQAYVDGLDKQDLKLSPVGDGWALTGFLPIDLGAKLHTYLSSTTAPKTLPDGTEDTRTAAQRRLDSFEALIDTALKHGLPVDRGVRPHLSILMDHQTLVAAQTSQSDEAVKPAHLVGFGPIGKTLATQLMCDTDITPVLLDSTTHQPLDVAATERFAKLWMRRGINATQGDCCAAPGCTNRIGHLHHIVPWSKDGPTTFRNMIGLCSSCHRLVHTNRLTIDPATHAVTRPSGVTTRFNPANRYLREQHIHRRLRALFRRAA